jgi:glycosyltransferase involved in cell wall biosynthesis
MLYHPHPSKGYDIGVRALDELCRRRPVARVVVFGMNPPRNLPEGDDFRRALSHRELSEQIYNASKVFIQPSYYEGFGYTALEAMACGSALVTTDNGGSHDYAMAGETAVVVEPGDWNGLATGIETLLHDDDERARLATAGERHTRSFEWDRTAAMLEQHLVEYLADPAALQHPSADDGYDARPAGEKQEAR